MAIELKCCECEHIFTVDCQEWILVSSHERKQETETIYEMEIDTSCPQCGNRCSITIFKSVSPNGIYDYGPKVIKGKGCEEDTGCEVISFDCP
jgi:hypothetical protein